MPNTTVPPLPKGDSIFGWIGEGRRVTALVIVYPKFEPEPVWSAMPLVGAETKDWPPFVTQDLDQAWTSELFQGCKFVDLTDVIRETQQIVYWVPMDAPDVGAGVIVTNSPAPFSESDSFPIPNGVYVYHAALTLGVQVLPAEGLLARGDKVDLGLVL